MNRVLYVFGGAAALLLALAVQWVGLIRPSAGAGALAPQTSQPMAAATAAPDASSAIDDLAAWPVAAGR